MASERLSDLDLDALIQHGCSSGVPTPPLVRDAIVRAGLELRERRATDLTSEDREALDDLRSYVGSIHAWSPMHSRALAILDRLLGAK